jgi:hypothetical protein
MPNFLENPSLTSVSEPTMTVLDQVFLCSTWSLVSWPYSTLENSLISKGSIPLVAKGAGPRTTPTRDQYFWRTARSSVEPSPVTVGVPCHPYPLLFKSLFWGTR